MPGAARVGDTTRGTGTHPGKPPATFDGTLAQGSADTTANSRPQVRAPGDRTDHQCPYSHPHGVTKSGSKDTFVNSREAVRDGDPIDETCPGAGRVTSGSPDVLIN